MAEQEPLDTTAQDAEPLPERIRVHALAKRLGVTSKRILAKLTELGSEARSAQSNVDRAVAESVRDALVEPTPEPEPLGVASTAAADSTAAPGLTFSAPDPEIARSKPELAEGEVEPAAHQPSAQLFTHIVEEKPHVAESVGFEPAADVQAPLFLPPDAVAAEQARQQRRAQRETQRAEREARAAAAAAEAAAASDSSAAASGAEREDAQPAGSARNGATDAASDEASADQESADQPSDSDDQPRRRRRGRRGRGRGRGEQGDQPADDETDSDATAATNEAESGEAGGAGEAGESAGTPATDTDDDDEGGSTRRRRRRRRRKVSGDAAETDASEDDPPNTVVHEREPRNKSRGRAQVDEVQGISGSTRLEAKRQRRRDGREAGRRRPPILTESEFLARREAVDRVMVVREKAFQDHPTATQVAVLEDNILVEHFVTSTGSASMVGNVYLGKVQNVLPSMEAAFVDIGRGRNGVLYAGEVNWEAAGLGGRERKIEQALKPGDQVLVQVSKDPVGHKGARLTTQISLAGRFLVYVPSGTSTGISRKLPDTERKRLKEILRDIVPADAGVIIRTASEGVSEAELARDVERLQATWRTIEQAAEGKDSGAPKALYEEPDLLVKVVRDLFNEDFAKLVIEGDRAWSTVENYVRTVAPDMLARVSRHDNASVDVFETYRIDEQLAKALDRKVWLPSGGTLVIDRTEAMTVVDVNTGKFTGAGGSNLEETVTRNNLEAAEEIVRQMRLRDIGGMIVVDFIDMVLESNRDLVLRRLTEALGRDRTRHQVSEVTSLGLVQMTRKKLGTGLVEAFSSTCEHCHGRGILVHTYPVEPSAAEESASRGKETGSRRRRGRDKSGSTPNTPNTPNTPQSAPDTTPAPSAEPSDEDIAVKRAHPVALAMAAHHGEDSPDAPVDEVAAQEPEAVAAEPAAVASVAAEGRSARNGASKSAVSERAVPEPVAAKPAEAEAAPRKAGRRRVARSAAAPAADSSGAVFVLPTTDDTAAPTVDYTADAPVAVPPRSRPRRRAVGRPAGAPEAPN